MDRLDALERLARLRQQGMLTDAEFAAEKARLLVPGSTDPVARPADTAAPAATRRLPTEPASEHDRRLLTDAGPVGDEPAPWEYDAAMPDPATGDAPRRSPWPMVATGALAIAAVVGAAVWFGRSEVAPEQPTRHPARKSSPTAAATGLPALSADEARRQAFVAAFGYAPPTARSLAEHEDDDGDNSLFSPVALIPVGSHLAVVAVHQGPSYHAAAGALSVRYVDRTADGFHRLATNEVRVETGSFGSIAGWKLRRDLAAEPVIAVEGGGTWQGCSGMWIDLVALTPSAPILLAKGIPTSLGHEGEEQADQDAPAGGFTAALARSGNDILVRYSGDPTRTVRYARDGDRLVPNSEPPPSC